MSHKWLGFVVGCALLPAGAGAVEKQPSEPPGSIVGSLAFMLGFGDQFEVEGHEDDAASTLGVIPAIEKRFGSVVAVGLEYMFAWAAGEDEDAERRLIMSPHVRVRMSFPVYDKTTFDGMLGLGPTIWTSDDKIDGPFGDTRFGWSLRFAFGGSYSFNESVSAFADLGYYTTTSYGDDITATLASIPFTLGLRSSF